LVFAIDPPSLRRIVHRRGETGANSASCAGRRLVAVPPGTTRFYVDHDVDWVTGAELVVRDGYTTCRPQ
jgi:hypothetical protein